MTDLIDVHPDMEPAADAWASRLAEFELAVDNDAFYRWNEQERESASEEAEQASAHLQEKRRELLNSLRSLLNIMANPE